VIDGVIPANPAAAVTRPKVAWEGQKRTVLHPAGVRCPARCSPNLRPERPRPGLPARHARAAGVGSLRDRHHRRRTTGPILRTRTGRRMDRAGASRALTRSLTPLASPARSARTVCAALSAPPGCSPASASETCSTRCATPTHARHGQGQPRPPRRPRRRRLPGRHEHRLTSRPVWRGTEHNRQYARLSPGPSARYRARRGVRSARRAGALRRAW